MACPAHSTLAPTPSIPPASLSATSVAIAYAVMSDAEASDRTGLGCVILADGPVFFDASRYPMEGESILVVFGDGRMAVATMPRCQDDPRRAVTPGRVMVEAPKPWPYRAKGYREEAALVGLVRG